MKNKKGISLIVLIVTIIVIIILAAAVILTLNKNNPIDSSRVAQLADSRVNINSAISLYYGKKMAETQGIYDANHIFTAKDSAGNAIEGMTSIVGDQVGTSQYYAIASNVKDTLEITIPNMNGASGWYIDVNTGLVYLAYPSKDAIPDWMFNGEGKTNMDATLAQFVKILGSDTLTDVN